ncbi:hypothetical protein [Siccirubricoccus phaeus]|uniref:hypothetical protein n=1 Tax=Siccirubricoccus phaeus TaxID=2595053 RepID=UPI0011F2818D|nr:hypothetical protein [Siccirubricoccus phaeus]
MAGWLWSLGTLLVALGLAAHLFGWDTLLWLPAQAVEAIRADPGTYGVVALGVALMVLARLISRWRS